MAQTLSNIAIKPCTVTWNSTDLGYTSGDIEVSFEEQSTDITTHQTGTEILDSIRTGTNIEVTLTLAETSVAQLKTLFEVAGGTNTPSMGTSGSGWGSSQRFSGQLADAQLLVLKPVGAADNTENLSFWKAYPMPGSITISGENPKNVSVSFKVFEDSSKLAVVNKFIVGDQTQDFDA